MGLRVDVKVYLALTSDSMAATRFSRTANSSISTFLLREFLMNSISVFIIPISSFIEPIISVWESRVSLIELYCSPMSFTWEWNSSDKALVCFLKSSPCSFRYFWYSSLYSFKICFSFLSLISMVLF